MEENRSINLRLPIYKVNMCDPWRATDYVKGHFDGALFIVDDDVSYFLCSRDSEGYLSELLIPREIVDSAVIDEVRGEMESAFSELLSSMSSAIASNRKVLDSLRDEISAHAAVVNEMWDGVVDDMKDNHKEVMMRLGDMPRVVSGEGTNVLDVARAFAVISKPELIKELNK